MWLQISSLSYLNVKGQTFNESANPKDTAKNKVFLPTKKVIWGYCKEAFIMKTLVNSF